MLEKALPAHWLEKLKSEIENTSTSVSLTQDSNFNIKAPENLDRVETAKNYREPVPEIPESEGEEDIIDDPMEIDFVRKKEPATDVVTARCKIKRLTIPGAGLDSCANIPVMTDDIAKRAKLTIDTKEKHDLSGVATTPTESIGVVRNVPVTFAPGCTIYSDFAVIKYHKPMLILPNTLLDKYDYDLLASKRELKLVCDGKEFFIPVNMHKVKNKLEVNCMTAVQSVISPGIDADTDESEQKKSA